MSDASLDRIAELVGQGGEADDVLRGVVGELATRPEIDWAGIFFHEGAELALGPEAGQQDVTRRSTVPILYRDARVGDLAVDGVADPAFLEQVASRIAAHVLLGWDTGGEAWDP
jgi:hypothetical protein